MFIHQGKTNWILIIVVALLAGAIGGGLVMYINDTIQQTTALSQTVELQKPEKIQNAVQPNTNNINNGNQQNEYQSVALKDVMNYSNSEKNVYVKTSGIILGLRYDMSVGGEILLSDNSNSGNFLLVPICHACVANYIDTLATLKPGDKIEVSGTPSFTVPKDANYYSDLNLKSAPSFPATIGMLSVGFPPDEIKKLGE
jgi:uncharacterized protein YxeA